MHDETPDPRIDIPSIFHNFLTNAPFTDCISCERKLLEEETPYMIEKVLKRDDVIIEYAMCFSCAERKRQQLSEDSREKIEAYFNERVDFIRRAYKMYGRHGFEFDGWIDQCLLTGNRRSEMKEYHLHGSFSGDQLTFGVMPYIISSEVMVELSGLLSAKTKDEMDRFIDENFGLPPELKNLLKDRDLVMV